MQEQILMEESYDDIDRMINEGLGGGLILYGYDLNKFELENEFTLE